MHSTRLKQAFAWIVLLMALLVVLRRH